MKQFVGVMPQSHTHLRTLTESFGSNRNRPQKNEGGASLHDAFAIAAGSNGSLRINTNVSGLMRSIDYIPFITFPYLKIRVNANRYL